MTISAAHWRGRRLPGPGAPASPAEPRGAQPELLDPVARRARHDARVEARVDRAGAAATVNDRFMDVVVLLSVLVFLTLVTGVGMLVLQGAR